MEVFQGVDEETAMTQRFTRSFRVRHYELDALGHLNNVVFVQYLQEAAIDASTALGFGPDWYRERHVAWVVRRLTIRYVAQVTWDSEVDVTTWVSHMGGVRSTREYEITLRSTGARVARARAEWVHIDAATGQPARFPDSWAQTFAPTGESAEDLGVRMTNPRPTQDARRYVSRRRVQFHEVDAAQHVNHAVYLRWVGEAYFEAIRAAGHPLEQTSREGWIVFQAGHDIECFAPAFDHENIEIVSWICELGKVRGAWTHEIFNCDSGKLLARDYSLGAFVNLEGKPTVLPEQVLEDVVGGPARN
jgi:acyl-CoA thioester hydrolase